MIKTLIVDDEPLARRLLRHCLAAHSDIEVLAECSDGEQALRALDQFQPDLVFLDVQMPHLNGLEVLRRSGREHGVVFTTAFDEHALAAFEHHAVDFLLKPFGPERLDRALAKARTLLGQVQPQLQHAASQAGVLVKDRHLRHWVVVNDIVCVQAQDDYVCLHLADGRNLLKTQTLSDFEKELAALTGRFVRVHRSWLLHLDHFKAQVRPPGGQPQVLTRSGQVLPLSRGGHERLQQALAAAAP
jgi:two-component system LytT family response regulator